VPAPPGERVWLLKLPLTKPLNLNHRQHWAAKAADVRQLREDVQLLARARRLPKGCERVRITLIYRPLDPNRRRDVINITPTLKAAEDGLVSYGLIPDDTPVYIEPTMPVIEPPLPGQKVPEVWLKVEQLA